MQNTRVHNGASQTRPVGVPAGVAPCIGPLPRNAAGNITVGYRKHVIGGRVQCVSNYRPCSESRRLSHFECFRLSGPTQAIRDYFRR